jgi:hypothetical protein
MSMAERDAATYVDPKKRSFDSLSKTLDAIAKNGGKIKNERQSETSKTLDAIAKNGGKIKNGKKVIYMEGIGFRTK